jgi:hypothetical protein
MTRWDALYMHMYLDMINYTLKKNSHKEPLARIAWRRHRFFFPQESSLDSPSVWLPVLYFVLCVCVRCHCTIFIPIYCGVGIWLGWYKNKCMDLLTDMVHDCTFSMVEFQIPAHTHAFPVPNHWKTPAHTNNCSGKYNWQVVYQNSAA